LEDGKEARAVFIPTGGSEVDLACAAYLASLADTSPEAKVLGELAIRKVGLLLIPEHSKTITPKEGEGLCGVDLESHKIRIGTLASIRSWVRNVGGTFHDHLAGIVEQIALRGDMAVVVACEAGDLGVIALGRSRAS
jgi:high-affinity K+ transport system ATPase subunit B